MRDVAVIGGGMIKFGKYLDMDIRDLTRVAVLNAVKDAGISLKEIQFAAFGNTGQGLVTGQEGLRGQLALREVGLTGIPIINVELACASSINAFQMCCMAIGSGYCDSAIAVGAEKMFMADTARTLAGLGAGGEVDSDGRMGMFMPAKYAMEIKAHMTKYGTTEEQIAKVSVKNHKNGCLNPYAQYQMEVTVEQVLNSPIIAWPIRIFMAAPISDGAAAVILTTKKLARTLTTTPVIVAATEFMAGRNPDLTDPNLEDLGEVLSKKVYEQAGIGPEDVNVVELHNAMSSAELLRYEHLGICKKGEAGKLVDEGATEITGRIPVNTSGGLEARGHPAGATGAAQILEIMWQLLGDAGKRQVEPRPKVGLIQNGGGWVGGETSSQTITILKR